MTPITRLRRIRHVALDLDGTIYKDSTLFPATLPFLGSLRELGVGTTFVTNNSSRSTREYVAHLRRMGIEASASDIYSSTHATLEYLCRERPTVRRLFVLGTESLREEFMDEGYTLCGESPGDEPDAVVVGFDTGLVYERLCKVAYWIAAGKAYVATHPDRVCPTGEPTVLVDCGSICAALELATGRKPEAIPGKPDRRMLDGVMQRHDLRADELAMVGDRIYTDIVMARAAGVLGVLVLTGEATVEEASACAEPPDLVVEDLSSLREMLCEAK